MGVTELSHPRVAFAETSCVACPEQVDGRLSDGRTFYFRYRFGRATLGLGDDRHGAVRDPERALVHHGDPLQGAFDSEAERDTVFAELVEKRLAR